jgi:hypothetical protein
MKQYLEILGPVLKLFIFLAVIFLFLGLEMSSPYTRESPDCSIWCVLENKLLNFVGMGD